MSMVTLYIPCHQSPTRYNTKTTTRNIPTRHFVWPFIHPSINTFKTIDRCCSSSQYQYHPRNTMPCLPPLPQSSRLSSLHSWSINSSKLSILVGSIMSTKQHPFPSRVPTHTLGGRVPLLLLSKGPCTRGEAARLQLMVLPQVKTCRCLSFEDLCPNKDG